MTNREWVQPPITDNGIKISLSMTLSARANFSFSHHQFLQSGSLHKPLTLFHQRADRRSKNHNPTTRIKPLYRKLISMKKQKVILQMKGQDKTPGKQLNEVVIGKLPEKELWIMIVKMIPDLGKTMEKMQEMFPKHLTELKNKQTEIIH